MALRDLLTNKEVEKNIEIEVSKDRIMRNLDEYRGLIAYWRMYPDKLVDYYCSIDPRSTFKFYWYQRLMLRVLLRHTNVYMVFCRAYSKSFIGVLSLMLKAILYPGIKQFTVADVKSQSAMILSSKVDELCKLIPALGREIIWDVRGNKGATTRSNKDEAIYTFRNGSIIQNVAMAESTRGARFQSGLMEEAATLDQDKLQQIIVPTLNISRRCGDGSYDPDEIVNQSQVYVTSAGYKGTFAYDAFIQTLCQCIARPKRAMVLGGDWRLPVKFGAIPSNFVSQLKMDGSFNEATFDREYNSLWGGDAEAAFFNSDMFTRNRTLLLAESAYNGRTNENGYYVMGIDVGRFDCTTEMVVIKVTPTSTGNDYKQIVNILTIKEEDFFIQAVTIKRMFMAYRCKAIVIDANGVGAGLVDVLIHDQTDPDSGELLPSLGVIYKDNEERERYKKYEGVNTIVNSMYLMKANAPLNTELYSYCQTQLRHNRLKFLIDEVQAKTRLLDTQKGKAMTSAQMNDYLMPYVMTSILKEQMVNMVSENDGVNIILRPANKRIKHDKFSALIYGLYYCKMQEDRGTKRKSRDISKMMLFSPGKKR